MLPLQLRIKVATAEGAHADVVLRLQAVEQKLDQEKVSRFAWTAGWLPAGCALDY